MDRRAVIIILLIMIIIISFRLKPGQPRTLLQLKLIGVLTTNLFPI
jgi:hypothetical protein